MKILAFVDTHGSLAYISRVISTAKREKPDFLICAGDLTFFGSKLKQLILKLKSAKIPLIIIPGNHETNQELKQISEESIICLDRATYTIGDYTFFGYSEGGFLERDPEFEKIAEKVKKSLVKNKKLILIFHAPPYGTNTDKILGVGHVGNKSLRKFIEQTKPKLVICGHIHECENKKDKIKDSLIINPGPKGKILEI